MESETVSPEVFSFGLVESGSERDSFIAAWEAGFARRLDRAVYEWIFNDRNLLYVVRNTARDVVAGYGMLTTDVVLERQRRIGALCNNVFVRPEYQAQNLFVKLGRFALADCEKRGVAVAVGMPNKNAVPGHKRVGWTFLDPISFLEKPADIGVDSPLHPKLIEVDASNVGRWLSRIETLSAALSSDRGFSVVKTATYFEWRYFKRPGTTYRCFIYADGEDVRGFIVAKFYEPSLRLHIVDIEAAAPDVFDVLLRAALYCGQSARLVNVWGSTVYADRYMANGFRVSTESNNLIMVFPYRKEPVSLKGPVNLVLGDNDVF